MSEPAPQRYRALLGLSRAALFWERLWPRLCPLAMVAGVFVAVALLDVLPALPGWAHVLALLMFAAALAGALWYAVPGFRPISEIAARRRLETGNGVEHRPLTALEDRLAIGADDPGAEALWMSHRRRMAEQARALSVRPPAPGMARLDPWGVRAAVILLLVIGLAAGGGEAETRMERALTPGLGGGVDQAARVEIWITPPEYTGVPPLFLKGGVPASTPDGVVEVPAGSALLARVAGVGEAPVLVAGESETGFEVMGDTATKRVYRAETRVDEGDRLSVKAAGRDLAAWPLRVIPDAPPEIAFSAPPSATPQGFLTFEFEATDDYGVSRVVAVIADMETGSESADIRQDLPLPALNAKSVASSSTHDLTAHALAGRPVSVWLEAEDAGGNISRGKPVEMVLPERTFSHPVAKIIVEERKKLEGQTTENRIGVARTLGVIAARPEHFGHDPVVSLALSVAKARLIRDRGPDAVPSVRTLLWETALRLEDGTVPLAERELRNARQRLWEALRGDASLAEIERLMNDLQRALDEYLAAVAAQLARRGESVAPMDPPATTLRSDDLRDMIEMARQLARSGSREGARQMLAELQRMLETIRSGMRVKGQGKDLMEAHRLMQQLRGLAERQQGLLDQTFEWMRDREKAGAGAEKGDSGKEARGKGDAKPGAGQGAADQEELRRALGELIEGIDSFTGAIPQPMTGADRAMRGAGEALGSDRLKDALGLQTRAVEHLNQAIEAAKGLMAQRLGGVPGMFSGDPDEFGDEDGDIFGRSPGSGTRGFGLGQVKIPDQMELRRAQEILQELRRRAGERDRPSDELRYIDRLLNQF